ncbi:hypothetical protein [Acaryochloris marina]|nr:hypothetical protein [Acaryochloris marina]BDM80677.1 hypothetical protein AM10699_35450 [Acaryochloris marina MBIC10699]
MTLHIEFKSSTIQFWKQLEMFQAFIQYPELGVQVSIDQDPINRIFLRSEHCGIEVPERPTIMFRATIIDALPLASVEAMIQRFTFKTEEQSCIATLGLMS